MTNIAIITSAYPYYPGEQFIEDEIHHWEKSNFSEIYIIPSITTGPKRETPERIKIINKKKDSPIITTTLKALTSELFITEIQSLIAKKELSLKKALAAAKCAILTKTTENQLRDFISKYGEIDIAYTYWNESQSYAACLLKKEGLIKKVISRAHGFDLYKERRPENYMPLKPQFIHQIDHLFVLSEEGKSYLEKAYGANPGKISISPLGVSLPPQKSPPNDGLEIHIVSLSYCVQVKRIDKIISTINLLSKSLPDKNITWTHIGDGPLKSSLENLAKNELSEIGNVKYNFTGEISNKDVRSFFLENKVDVIINASESEGIPVSIMEAMSYGIPAIAPNVGGVAYLVSNDCGHLLNNSPTPEDICHAITSIVNAENRDLKRDRARSKVEEKFNSEKNHNNFIKKIEAMVHNVA